MRRFPPLFTTPKSPSPSPNITVKSGPHSDALWKLYKELIDTDPDPDPDSSKTSNSSGVYYTTDTILDLDADKSPAARPYTPADHSQQIAKWGTNHALEALTKRMHVFRDEISDAKLAWRRKLGPFDERRITERDVLVMALLGPFAGPSDGDGNRNGQLTYEFLERIGISRRITADGEDNDIPLTVRYLAHRVKTQRTQGQGQGQRQVPADTQTQTESPHGDDPLANTKDPKDDASTGTGSPSRRRPDTTTVQQIEQKKTKTKTKAQQIKHLKSVLRKSDPQSIPRVLYPLLNDNHGRALIAECHGEIISGMTTKPIPNIAEPDEQVETTIQAAIFLKNLAYNLLKVKRGDLALSQDLTSVWSKILDYTGESTPLITDSAAESKRPSTGNTTPNVDVAVERASSGCATAGIAPVAPESEPEPEPRQHGHVLT